MPLLTYSVYRVLLIVGAGAILYAFGARSLTLAILAIFVGMLLSYLVLKGPRDKAAKYLADRKAHRDQTGEQFSSEIEADAKAEDAEHYDD